jgi:hypothetical protein
MGKGKSAKVIDVDGVQLTPKEFAFCNFFLQHQNAQKAVIEAGYSVVGKKPSWVAYELLHRDRVKKYLAIQFKVSLIKEKTSAIMDEFLTSDLGEIYYLSGNSFNIEKMHKAGVSHLIKKHKVRKTTKTDKAGVTTVTEEVTIEREDKIRAAEVLSKLQGWIGCGVDLNKDVVPAAQKMRECAKEYEQRGLLKCRNNPKKVK